MYTVYGIEYNHKIIYIGYRKYNTEEELNKEDYIKYTIHLLFKNNGTYLSDIMNNKELTQNNVIIFKNMSGDETAVIKFCEDLSYLIVPKYNEINIEDRDMFYVFPRDDREIGKKEAVAAADVLTPEEELLLLTN